MNLKLTLCLSGWLACALAMHAQEIAPSEVYSSDVVPHYEAPTAATPYEGEKSRLFTRHDTRERLVNAPDKPAQMKKLKYGGDQTEGSGKFKGSLLDEEADIAAYKKQLAEARAARQAGTDVSATSAPNSEKAKESPTPKPTESPVSSTPRFRDAARSTTARSTLTARKNRARLPPKSLRITKLVVMQARATPEPISPFDSHLSHPDLLAVRPSPIEGTGVFARRRIRKDDCIIEYTGERVPWSTVADESDTERTYYFGIFDGNTVINPERGGNEARWINHSCEPNCEAIEEEDGRVFIYALRDIAAGDELCYDYQLEVDEPRTPEVEAESRCHCGTAECRGTMLAPV